MKLVKTSAIACALAALIATPVLAQGTLSGAKPGGTVQSKPMQGGAVGSEDEDLGAQQGAAGAKVGMKSTKGTKGTVGTPAARRTRAQLMIPSRAVLRPASATDRSQ